MWETLKNIEPVKPVRAVQPPAISRKLKSFQLEGLDWMVKQEQTQWKGGLLGDEMGMGKTIQAVSLIMSDYPAKNPTLVLVPPVALMQWQSEIAVSALPASLFDTILIDLRNIPMASSRSWFTTIPTQRSRR